MSFSKLSFILQSIPSDIKNSSCRLFHLTLDFISHTSLVSFPDLYSVLSFSSFQGGKKKDNLSSIPRVPTVYTSPPIQTPVWCRSSIWWGVQLVIAGEGSQTVDYLTLIPASHTMLCNWISPAIKISTHFTLDLLTRQSRLHLWCR